MGFLSAEAIRDWQPYPADFSQSPLQRARERVSRANSWTPGQSLGRYFGIGCVSLEITQRCNLDCTACYLSESSEALKDIPLEEVFRRIDLIHAHYGDKADVQVSGGDPTLRKRDELVAIVKYISDKRMRPSLFTNGILASREMLAELAAVGLMDVAFHVDMTQERKGYGNEHELNQLRDEYIGRARGLPLNVIFNTTVFPGNLHEVADLVRFFKSRSEQVHFISFQLQADTGRGVLSERGDSINPANVTTRIREGAGVALAYDTLGVGHADCNRYTQALVVNDRAFDLLDEPVFVRDTLGALAHLSWDRGKPLQALKTLAGWALENPQRLPRIAGWFVRKAWKMKADLWRARGRIGRLSIFIHNFMDAKQLEAERCEACSFMVMTPEGPMSMCVHNAKRDQYLLVPAQVKKEGVIKFWNPATGQLQDRRPEKIEVRLTRKNTRGRAKEALA